jgi:hypothetical protein
VSRPLNLASRPFRNEALPALLFGLAAVALLALSIQHIRTLTRLRPGRGTPLEQEVARLESEVARVRAEAGALRVPEPDASVIPRWVLIKELVDRRALRWTELLSVFEEALPGNVRLASLAPEVKLGRIQLELMLLARTSGEGLEVLRILEERPEFDEVYPLSFEPRADGEQVHYAMRYQPPPSRPAGEPEGEAPPQQDDAAEDPAAEDGGARVRP